MLSRRILAAHYAEYAARPPEWVAQMWMAKRSIVEEIFRHAEVPSRSPLAIVVLGTSDPRYLPIHQSIFATTTLRPVQLATLDVDLEHLGNHPDTLCHDVTLPLPLQADLVFSHELLKFLTPSEQAAAIQHAYLALHNGGLAMHVIHEPSIKGTGEFRDWQYRVDPNRLVESSVQLGIPCRKLVFAIESDIAWLRETTVLITGKKSA